MESIPEMYSGWFEGTFILNWTEEQWSRVVAILEKDWMYRKSLSKTASSTPPEILRMMCTTAVLTKLDKMTQKELKKRKKTS